MGVWTSRDHCLNIFCRHVAAVYHTYEFDTIKKIGFFRANDDLRAQLESRTEDRLDESQDSKVCP